MASNREAVFGTEHPVALVTGSGSPRVGNAIVRSLAARGYHVAIHANRATEGAEQTAKVCRELAGDAIAVSADLTDEAQTIAMIHVVHDHFSRIDLLVNCAAIWKTQRLEDVTADDVRQHLDVNTVGTFVCSQQVGLIMVRQESGGAIVNVGDWALDQPYLDYSAYFASKGTIPTLTRTFAAELASRNSRVRVNAVLPGRAMVPEELDEDLRRAAMQGNLLRCEGSAQHISDAVIFLAEHDFMTGVCLAVDGGRGIIGQVSC